MCGILGTINKPFDHSVLNLLKHRGPDDSGLSTLSVAGHIVTLGHRRLSILDVSPAGSQPMWTTGRKQGIVFNGEIYNHLQLREQLDAVHYRGHSDTETLLHLLAQRGVQSSEQLNGIFTFGFIDAAAGKLFLARDPFGVKPLYYWADDRSLAFSSEIRALQELVDAPLEPANLAELLRMRYLPAPDTLFKNIRKVRPGHIVDITFENGGTLSLHEYPFIRRSTEKRRTSHADAVTQYGHCVEQAVKRQLLSDVPVGVFLSGGVDSALVASLAQRQAGYRMRAFTVGFNEEHGEDEILEARETARIIGLDHHEVRIGFPEFLDILPRITGIVEEPLATTSVVPMFYVSGLASKQVKVVLSGQGADEAMGGYRRYQAELLRSFAPPFACRGFSKVARVLKVRNEVVLRGLESLGESGDIRRFEKTYGVFSADQIQRLTGYSANQSQERIGYFYDLLECANLQSSVQRMMTLDLRMNLSDDLLLYTDKITMHHSIECRVPLLDIELVKFVESLPVRQRVSFFRTKVIHKRFAETVLPQSIIRRKKKGFLSPTAKWFRATPLIREVLLGRNSRFSSYFELSEVAKLLDEHRAGMNRERHIFLLLSLYYWLSETVSRSVRPAPLVISTHA